jgi:hypothetical protein
MPSGQPYSAELKAEAVRLIIEGKSKAEVGRILGVHPRQVSRWAEQADPNLRSLANRGEMYERTREELSDLIYGTVIDTLKSLRARAIATADPDWIKGQDAHSLAALDATHWQYLVRFVASFRPLTPSAEVVEGETLDDESASHRNGAVDPAD